MCIDCGCQEANHKHNHSHHHHHDQHGREIILERNVLAQNDKYASENRKWFDQNNITAINIISSPGSGKTTLLEKTLETLKSEMNISIIVGDQQTANDAERLSLYSDKVKQINTISSCHLDAHMIAHELESFVTPETNLLIIENIGNLVCPAAFDLGEHKTVALLSTTEGEDKPIKYPTLFHKADAIVLTKTDLIPHLNWDLQKCLEYIKMVNPKVTPIQTSALKKEGLVQWDRYLRELVNI
jgi:hydrogenase nickel incorporation protein HypB